MQSYFQSICAENKPEEKKKLDSKVCFSLSLSPVSCFQVESIKTERTDWKKGFKAEQIDVNIVRKEKKEEEEEEVCKLIAHTVKQILKNEYTNERERKMAIEVP